MKRTWIIACCVLLFIAIMSGCAERTERTELAYMATLNNLETVVLKDRNRFEEYELLHVTTDGGSEKVFCCVARISEDLEVGKRYIFNMERRKIEDYQEVDNCRECKSYRPGEKPRPCTDSECEKIVLTESETDEVEPDSKKEEIGTERRFELAEARLSEIGRQLTTAHARLNIHTHGFEVVFEQIRLLKEEFRGLQIDGKQIDVMADDPAPPLTPDPPAQPQEK